MQYLKLGNAIRFNYEYRPLKDAKEDRIISKARRIKTEPQIGVFCGFRYVAFESTITPAPWDESQQIKKSNRVKVALIAVNEREMKRVYPSDLRPLISIKKGAL